MAWLRKSGSTVRAQDLAIEAFDESAVGWADLVAFFLPMHTATRLAARLIPKVRSLNPRVHVAAYGLYAPMNENYLRGLGVRTVLGGEFEPGLSALADRLKRGETVSPDDQPEPRISLARQEFVVPDRADLPALDRYAHLLLPGGEERTVGYVEASRGCKHRCRHCPVVPVYDGQFRIVPKGIVLADVRQQIAAGAQHMTFGDPDFLNGPGHAIPLVEAMHAEFPDLTYDVTIKIEHLLAAGNTLEILKETGCLFVTTAVESVDDHVLALLEKGHTRDDFYRVAGCFDALGLGLSPTFVPFTPWTTLEGYLDLLNAIVELNLVARVAPVQLTIRLLIPPGSRLLELAEVQSLAGPLDAEVLSYPWSSPDPRVDALHGEVQRLVQREADAPPGQVFLKIWDLAHARAGGRVPPLEASRIDTRQPPRLSEPWYCCAEPTDAQLALV
jgi:radical SAM superfamily enzyme YgiQ (UPF0313 family)